MRKTIIASIVLLIAIAFLAVKYFSDISGKSNNASKLLGFIPQDAALVFNFTNDESFYEIFRDYQVFDAITGQNKASEIRQLQQTLLKQPDLFKTTNDSKIFISFHPNKADSVDLLFSISLNNGMPVEEIEEHIRLLKEVSAEKNPQTNLYKIHFKNISKSFYLYLEKGLALGSFNPYLLNSCLDPKVDKLAEDFVEEINYSSNKNQSSPVNLFINHTQLASFAGKFFRGKASGNSVLLKNLKGISSLSMNFKSDALMFNGISSIDTTSTNYLQVFLNQKPVRNEIKRIIPANAANFLAFGLSNYKNFNRDLKVHLEKSGEFKKLQTQIRKIKSETGIDLERDIKPLWANEFAVVETSNREKFAIIRVSNGRKLNFSLQLISNNFSPEISQLNFSHIPQFYFGDPLESFTRPFFTVKDNYLIIANTPGVIQKYRNTYEKQDFLWKTRNFVEFNQLVANQSNILYFVNNQNSERVINAALKNKYAAAFKDDDFGLKDFYGLSYQWTSEKDHFFTNLYLSYKGEQSVQLTQAWQFQMKARLSSQPQVFHMAGQKIILVQDVVNNLYALSADGKELWSTQLNGKILGSIQQLSDESIILNTSRTIYRFRSEGSSVSGFPLNIGYNASAGLSLISSKVEECKIFLPASNIILGFDSIGKPLPGWIKTMQDPIADLTLIKNDNTDFVIAGTRSGYFHVFDVTGKELYKIDAREYGPFKNEILVEAGSDFENSKISTTNNKGQLISLTFEGNVSQKDLGDWTTDHYFYFRNITGDERAELIFLDKELLTVLSSEGNMVFTYDFDSPIKNKPLFFNVNQFTYQIGLSLSDEKKLFLFNEDGSLVKGFPFSAAGNFYVGSIGNDGHTYLLCSKKTTYLNAYKF